MTQENHALVLNALIPAHCQMRVDQMPSAQLIITSAFVHVKREQLEILYLDVFNFNTAAPITNALLEQNAATESVTRFVQVQEIA